MGAFYTEIFGGKQDLFINSKVLGQMVMIIVFYLKLLGVYYWHRRRFIYKAQAL